MAEKGFFDNLVNDFCRDLELKGAIETSRDENGKIDIAKATGISMGLGHTSDDDIVMLGAMLGAEGAFDDDYEEDYQDSIDYPQSPSHTYSLSNKKKKKKLFEKTTELDYIKQKKRANFEHRFLSTAVIFAIIVFTIFLIQLTNNAPEYSLLYLIMYGIILASLIYAITDSIKSHKEDLKKLEYRRSCSRYAEKIQEEKENIQGILKSVFDKYDDTYHPSETTHNPDYINIFILGMCITAISNSEHEKEQQSALFDACVEFTGIDKGLTGNMIFLNSKDDCKTIFSKFVGSLFGAYIFAADALEKRPKYKVLISAVCKLLMTIGNALSLYYPQNTFSETAVKSVVKTYINEAQKTIKNK